MGDVWIPDRALIIMRELLCSQTLLEDNWIVFEGDKEGRLRTALTAVMMIDVFAAALQGEEIVRVDLEAIQKHWDKGMLAGKF
jgi:hypothetical protein